MTDAHPKGSRWAPNVQLLPDPSAPWRPTWPFVLIAAAAFPLSLLPLGQSSDPGMIVLAAVLFVIASVLTLVPDTRWLGSSARGTTGPAWASLIASQLPVLFWCLTVLALEASGGGARAGYAPLLILPVVAQASYGSRRDLIACLILTTLTLGLPVFFWGRAHYPESEVRHAILWLITATGAGLVIERLVRESREKQRMVIAVTRLGRELDETADLGQTVTAGAARIMTADAALLFEPNLDGSLRLCGWSLRGAGPRAGADRNLAAGIPPTGTAPPPARARHDEGPGMVLDDRLDGVRVATVDAATGPLEAWLEQHGITRVMHVLATRHWRRHAVLTVGWRKLGISAAHELVPIAELLANEAVVALDRADVVTGLEEAAAHDALTGLPNRRTWDTRLASEVSRARRKHLPLAVALLDLDHFKRFNDTYGHVAGDKLLFESAQAWLGELRTSDLLARWGGEEFALLLADTDVEQAVEVVERLRAATPGGQTVSAGVAMLQNDADVTTLTDAADRALYAAKQAGRDRLAIARGYR